MTRSLFSVNHALPSACVVALAAGCSKETPPSQRPAPAVSVITVEPQTIPYSLSFVAQTESSQQVNIVARVSGYLDKIAYHEGDLVKQGQLLFQLDPKPFQAQLEAVQGELQSQQARHVTAKANLERVKPLAQQNALSQADLDRAQGEFDASKAAVYTAQAKVHEAELNLGYTTIRSPVTGLASRSLQRQGAFINAMSDSANLTYVAAIDPIWVNFSVSQNQTAKLREDTQKGRIVLPKEPGLRRRSGAFRRRGLPAPGKNQLRRPVVQSGYGLLSRAGGAAESEAGAAARHVRDGKCQGRAAPERSGRAAARRTAGLERAPGLCHESGGSRAR